MPSRRAISITLGAGLWLAALATVGLAVYTVHARVRRPVQPLALEVPEGAALAEGDSVFLEAAAGLQRIGEVREVRDGSGVVSLAIDPVAFDRLSVSTKAVCWRTPLSAEDVLGLLLPEDVQRAVGRRIAEGWRAHQPQVAAAWRPIASELASAYLRAVRGDLEAAVQRHEGELWAVAKTHGRALVARWPEVQARLRPILQEYLTPVLSRLMSEALDEAPTVSIAWNVARGHDAEALRRTLDWLADFLAQMSDEDRAEVAEAVRATWDQALDDPILAERLSEIGHGILSDEQLWDLVTQIYREAIADNPHTAEFFRSEVLDAPRVREQFYALIETYAPTVRNVFALCLFDDEGATRPEVVYVVRSTTLGRNVAWVTLHADGAAADRLEPGAVLRATAGGSRP